MSPQNNSEQRSEQLPPSIKLRMLADQIEETILDIQIALQAIRGLAEDHHPNR